MFSSVAARHTNQQEIERWGDRVCVRKVRKCGMRRAEVRDTHDLLLWGRPPAPVSFLHSRSPRQVRSFCCVLLRRPLNHTHSTNPRHHHEGDRSTAAGRHLDVLLNRSRVRGAPKLRAPKLHQRWLVSESESARNTDNINNNCCNSCFPAAAVGAEGPAAAAAAAARARAADGD